MGRLISQNRREIASKRFKFVFYEILPIFGIIFVLLILEWMLLTPIVEFSPVLFEFLFYYFRAIAIFLVITLFYFIYNRYKTSPSKDLALHIGYLKLYNITKSNYLYQMLYCVLLVFLILIPLDFLISITFPEYIPLRAFTLGLQAENTYLQLDNFSLFLFSSIIIQLSISFSEETVFRGLIAKRGSEHFNKVSAVIIATFYFTFAEVFLSLSYYYGVISFVKSFIIGLVLSLTVLRRKWLLPLIIAKTIDSIISNIFIWEFLRGGDITQPLIFIYSPLLIISLILLVLQRSRVKESLQIGKTMITSYLKNDKKLRETSGDKVFRILFDIFLAFILFLFGILISV
jgi:membrane protease YdiL (CAAX protease family)